MVSDSEKSNRISPQMKAADKELARMLGSLADLAGNLVDFPLVTFSLLDGSKEHFLASGRSQLNIQPHLRLFEAVLFKGETQVVSNVQEDKLFGPLPEDFRSQSEPIQSYAAIPLKNKVGPILGLMLVADFKPRVLNSESLRLLHQIANFAAYCLNQNRKAHACWDLASEIIHEISNPLALILGQAALLDGLVDHRKVSSDVAHHVANSIEKAVIKIPKIVESMLLTYILEFQDPQYEIVSVTSLARESLDGWKSMFEKAGILFKLILPNTDCEVECCAFQINQVLTNILRNALEAVKGRESGLVEMNWQVAHDHLKISVTDNGPGVPQEYADLIMNPHFTTKPSGKGLGLSISQRIVLAHHGELRLDRLQPGARFIVRLPLKMPLEP
jgi:two-component system, NtrC family, sensor histidine kinase AtoS